MAQGALLKAFGRKMMSFTMIQRSFGAIVSP